MDAPPLTFTHDTLHSVVNQLALIVSYADLLMGNVVSETDRADLSIIRQCAYEAARLLDRPLAEPGVGFDE